MNKEKNLKDQRASLQVDTREAQQVPFNSDSVHSALTNLLEAPTYLAARDGEVQPKTVACPDASPHLCLCPDQ